MAKTFLRCTRNECGELLTTEQKLTHGCCVCGGTRFRGVGEKSKFNPTEEELIRQGLAAWVDTSIPGVDPDVLNFDDPGYWARETLKVGEEEVAIRKKLAENRRDQCQKRR